MLVNLFTQRIVIAVAASNIEYFVALFLGTVTGLITKYYLDKNFIFNDLDNSIKNNTKKFSLYTFNGIFTTSIFWGTESIFFFIYKTSFARELGAIIGLTIGYILKYRLDKKYVF